MEGLSKIPMFTIPLKISPVAPDISSIKKKIRRRFGNQLHINENIFHEFLALRKECCKVPFDDRCLIHIKRYYAHLLVLAKRIDLSAPKLVEWPSQDAFLEKQLTRSDIKYEEAAILYSLGAAYSRLGQNESRSDVNSLKTACTLFQCAAGVFQSFCEQYSTLVDAPDMSVDLIRIYISIMLNQAQECFMENSILSKRPPNITAKLAQYLYEAYDKCLNALNSLPESTAPPARVLKDWTRMLAIKKSFYISLANHFEGQSFAAQMKFGIAVAHFQLAQKHIEAAMRIAKDFTNATEPSLGQRMLETVRCAQVIITTCCSKSFEDNSQIYHELVPKPSDLEKIAGACLAKASDFDRNDPTAIGEDIFKDLLPIETLESCSVYSEMKAEFLRKVMAEVEETDSELGSFLSSLSLDPQTLLKPDTGLPQPLLDICARLNIVEQSPEVKISSLMTSLTDVSTDAESKLNDLTEEIAGTWDRLNAILPLVPSSSTTSIKDQMSKVEERHKKFAVAMEEAKSSNTQLHEVLSQHLGSLRILLLPVEEIDASLPNANDLITDTDLLAGLDEAARIFTKVDLMRDQRRQMMENLREALQKDDVSQDLLVSDDRDALFKLRMATHDEAVKMIRLNMAAQENITKALIDVHAQIGVKKHNILERRQKRSDQIDRLIHSMEALDDLEAKCAEGQNFYREMLDRLSCVRSDLSQINTAILGLQQQSQKPASAQSASPSQPPALGAFVSSAASTLPAGGSLSLRDVLRAQASQQTSLGGVSSTQPSAIQSRPSSFLPRATTFAPSQPATGWNPQTAIGSPYAPIPQQQQQQQRTGLPVPVVTSSTGQPTSMYSQALPNQLPPAPPITGQSPIPFSSVAQTLSARSRQPSPTLYYHHHQDPSLPGTGSFTATGQHYPQQGPGQAMPQPGYQQPVIRQAAGYAPIPESAHGQGQRTTIPQAYHQYPYAPVQAPSGIAPWQGQGGQPPVPHNRYSFPVSQNQPAVQMGMQVARAASSQQQQAYYGIPQEYSSSSQVREQGIPSQATSYPVGKPGNELQLRHPFEPQPTPTQQFYAPRPSAVGYPQQFVGQSAPRPRADACQLSALHTGLQNRPVCQSSQQQPRLPNQSQQPGFQNTYQPMLQQRSQSPVSTPAVPAQTRPLGLTQPMAQSQPQYYAGVQAPNLCPQYGYPMSAQGHPMSQLAYRTGVPMASNQQPQFTSPPQYAPHPPSSVDYHQRVYARAPSVPQNNSVITHKPAPELAVSQNAPSGVRSNAPAHVDDSKPLHQTPLEPVVLEPSMSIGQVDVVVPTSGSAVNPSTMPIASSNQPHENVLSVNETNVPPMNASFDGNAPISPQVLTQEARGTVLQPPLEPHQDRKENPSLMGGSSSNGMYADLPSHLVNLSLGEGNLPSGGSPSTGNRRHYQARDFVDKDYRDTRDALADKTTVFEGLDPLHSKLEK